MKILGVDSSAKSASCALVEDNKLISELFLNAGLTHSETLMPMLIDTLKYAKVDINEIDYIAVTNGPGSFTGLRIGLAAVKGLCFTKDIPCVAVSSLEALAYNLKGFNGIICSAMDARCQQVYTAIFESDGNTITRLTDDQGISLDELEALLVKYNNLNKKIFFVGDGANLCYNKFAKIFDVTIAPNQLIFPKGSSVCSASLPLINNGNVLSSTQLVPEYLRLPQAERELNKKNALKNK